MWGQIEVSIIRPVRAAALVVSFVVMAPAAWAQLPLAARDSGEWTIAPMLREITPAVVNVSVASTANVRPNPFFDDPFFRRFFDLPAPQQQVPRQSVGSGVIVDAERGYVLTNHHVVSGADQVVVTLLDQRQFDAELVGSDEATDIALLRIEADNLTAAPIGDSGELEVGDFVVAIGNPFGLGQTVTSGIVSALGRTGLIQEGYEAFIQTDASINPGNSGGALITMDGRLVGINTAIVSPAGGNVGIGFAVPSDIARGVMEQLIEYGNVSRGRLGIYIQDLNPALAEALDLEVASGALVTQVEPGSVAAEVGLQPGDVVVAIDGQAITGGTQLRNRIGLMRAGTRLRVGFIRDGERQTVEATIRPEEGARLSSGSGGGDAIGRLEGAVLRNLDPSHPRYGEVEGVLVADLQPGSPAARAGVQPGDIVVGVNRARVRSVQELRQALQRASGTFALNILRGNAQLFIVIP